MNNIPSLAQGLLFYLATSRRTAGGSADGLVGFERTMVEPDLKGQADGLCCPVFLRNATAYGVSPRMRFDLVLNESRPAKTTKAQDKYHSC